MHFLDSAPTGDSLLDEGLEKIRAAKKAKSLEDWVSRFAGIKNLRHQIAKQLCNAGILRADEALSKAAKEAIEAVEAAETVAYRVGLVPNCLHRARLRVTPITC